MLPLMTEPSCGMDDIPDDIMPGVVMDPIMAECTEMRSCTRDLEDHYLFKISLIRSV